MFLLILVSEIWTLITRGLLLLHYLFTGHTDRPGFRQLHGYSMCPTCGQRFGYFEDPPKKQKLPLSVRFHQLFTGHKHFTPVVDVMDAPGWMCITCDKIF